MSRIRFSQITEPDSPTTDTGWVYLDTDGKLKLKIASGTVFDLTTAESIDLSALVGSDGITVTSGSNTIDIAGFRTEFVSASGSLQTEIDELVLGVTSNALVGSDGITVTSGSNTTTIEGFRGEFVSASGSLQSQIDTNTSDIANLDDTYATDTDVDSKIAAVSGTLSSEIDSDISTHASDSSAHHTRYTKDENDSIIGGSNITVVSGANTITISSASESAKAIVGGGANTVVSGSNTVTINDFFRPFQIFADMFVTPLNSDWAVNSFAPLTTTTANAAIMVRAFDDTTEEGVGWTLSIPTGVTDMTLKFKSAAASAPAGTRTVGVGIYHRSIPDNSAIGSWSTITTLTDISIPTNTNFQYDEQTLALSSLSITAGTTYQFELTRMNPASGTELSGDWHLMLLEVEFN